MGARGADRQRVRIVGGTLRGRLVGFPDQPGLRPTPDRVRETLFNWLQIQVPGARCLDLFAGSGVLGFEALSRGARQVVMLDASAQVVRMLQENAGHLGLGAQVDIHQADALRRLEGPVPADPFDLVFVDPPFAEDLVGPVVAKLAAGGWLAPGACLYIEQDRRAPLPPLPGDWCVSREKTAGKVSYRLIRLPEA